MENIYRKLNNQETLRAKYPKLLFETYQWIDKPASTHLFIDDLSTRSSDNLEPLILLLQQLSFNRIRVLSSQSMVNTMESLIDKDLNLNPENTLLIFPGEGANTVKNLLSEGFRSKYQTINVAARREKDLLGNVVGISLPWESSELKQQIKGRNVLIIDDVIDTGKTIIALKRKLDSGQTWVAAAPIVFSPLPYSNRSNESSLPDFDKIIASLVLEGPENPVPLNSLSSLVEGGPKTKKLLQRCVSLCPDGQEMSMLSSISQIGQLGGYV